MSGDGREVQTSSVRITSRTHVVILCATSIQSEEGMHLSVPKVQALFLWEVCTGTLSQIKAVLRVQSADRRRVQPSQRWAVSPTCGERGCV